MSEETAAYSVSTNGPAPMVTPDGSRLITRRPGRELFPSSWLRHRARIIYGVGDQSQDLSGVLLEFCSVGLIVQANGSKNLVSWDALQVVELIEG